MKKFLLSWPVVCLFNAGSAAWNWWTWAEYHWWINLFCAVLSTAVTIFIPLRHRFSKW